MKRVLNVGHTGDDVAYAQRLLAGRNVFKASWYTGALDGDYGEQTRDAAHDAKWALGYPAKKCIGNFGTKLERQLKGLDKLPLAYRQRRKKRLAGGKPIQVPLVEPRQGFGSLATSLWLAYSIGRKRRFTDLGTYVNKPGDHGVGPPALAFDLGDLVRFNFLGWNYLKARRLATYYVRYHVELGIEYVILGRRIWSRKRAKEWSRTRGWHPLTTGDTSHDFHIHVSGHR